MLRSGVLPRLLQFFPSQLEPNQQPDSIVLALQMKQPIHVANKVLENVEDMSEILERILRKQD